MNKKHLIVLDDFCPSRMAHLRKIRSLRDQFHFTFLFSGTPSTEYMKHFGQEAIKISFDDTEENHKNIIDLVANIPPADGIINLSEPMLPIHSHISSHYGFPGPSPLAARVGRNKYNMRKFAKNLSIPVPDFIKFNSENINMLQRLNFPVVIKPVFGGGSSLVKMFSSFDELTSSYPSMEKLAREKYKSNWNTHFKGSGTQEYTFIAEEVIGGDLLYETTLPVTVGEISVESIFVDGDVNILAIHDKPLPANGPYFEEVGYSTPTRIPDTHIKLAHKYVSDLHHALGNGTFLLHTEFRTLDKGLVLLEFGVRMGGSAIYRSVLASTGNDYVEMQIQSALGMPVQLSEKETIPTITQYIFPEKEGLISSIYGETNLVQDPTYLEHQIYDDVGSLALRAPLATRSTMYCMFQDESFANLEKRVLSAVENFKINVED